MICRLILTLEPWCLFLERSLTSRSENGRPQVLSALEVQMKSEPINILIGAFCAMPGPFSSLCWICGLELQVRPGSLPGRTRPLPSPENTKVPWTFGVIIPHSVGGLLFSSFLLDALILTPKDYGPHCCIPRSLSSRS